MQVWESGIPAAALAALLAWGPAGPLAGQETKNGFALDPSTVPADEVLAGGPPRDGIPALMTPRVQSAAEAGWADDEMVLAIAIGGEARAYPIAILSWHELVNDELGGQPILVSYCPLCGTGLAFDRRAGGRARTFGVSGLLYRSDLLLYDRETESLWSQIASEAVTGPALGTRLRLLRSEMARWGEWKRDHPATTVLSPDTGHRRDYGRSPYGDYAVSERLYFPVPQDARYHPKMPTLGARLVGGPARAYPAAELVRAGGSVEDRLAGRAIRVSYDPERQVFDAEAPSDVELIEGYWFAWAAFHPQTTVFVVAPEPDRESSPSPDHP